MKLLIATDAHFFVLPDNTYWCDSVETYSFWTRYLEVFDDVRIVARVKHLTKLNGNYRRADGPRVGVWEIPFFQGALELLKKYFKIHHALKKCFDGCDCALFRMPSQTALMTLAHINKKMPYSGEVVYSQRDSLTGQRFGITWVLNGIISERLKRFCLKANGVSYVTEHTIQRYYPCHAHLYGADETHFEAYYSSITLDEEYFLGTRDFSQNDGFTFAISDAAMNGDRKGEPTFLKIIMKVRELGYNVSAIIIGDGNKKKDFEQLAVNLGIADYVTFTGQLFTPKDVRDCLKEADIYLLPTSGEGLPRGIIEAMALGMPVLSTPVGGIPEVIDKAYLFEPQDVKGFVNKICNLIDNKDELNEMSRHNFKKSLEFKNDVLQVRRNDFYTKLKKTAH